MHPGSQERHGIVDSGVLGIPTAELEGLECMAKGMGLWAPQKFRDLEWGFLIAVICIHPLDEGVRAGGECGVQGLVAFLAQRAGGAEGLAGGAE